MDFYYKLPAPYSLKDASSHANSRKLEIKKGKFLGPIFLLFQE